MITLRDHLEQYLRLRRALGFQLNDIERQVGLFCGWLEDRGQATTFSIDDAVNWARLNPDAHPSWWATRLSLVRRFAAHLNSNGVDVPIIPGGLLAAKKPRAVPYIYSQDDIDALLDACAGEDFPIHIHIAEQMAEVEECVAVRGARPVRWLLDHAPVDSRWTLVHATHLADDELAGIISCGATVSICPTTEANLGDGLFRLPDFLDAGGRFSIGSDSNVSVSPVEELRWLEYGQRLVAQRRNIAASSQQPSCGATLLEQAWQGGALSSGMPLGSLEPGRAGDWIVLDERAPALAGMRDEDALDRLIFAGNRSLVDQVYVGGRCLVRGGRHQDHDKHAERYRVAIRHLLAM